MTLKLTCEYSEMPLGVQNRTPRFGWRAESVSGQAAGQAAYRITVRDEAGTFVWDSGRVASGRCSAVPYEGAPLKSFSRYDYTVAVWLKDGKTCLQGTDFFETGILEQAEWQGDWIFAPEMPKGVVPLFRRSFQVETLPARARIYLSGIGYCEAWINGIRLGDSFLDPGWTDYRKTVLYRVYDITPFLRTGENVFAAELGGGWLTLDHEAFQSMIGRKTDWLSEPKLRCDIRMDGECLSTRADGTWHYADGPTCCNDLYDGEYYDAGRERPGYRLPGYREEESGGWKPAALAESPGGVMRSQMMPPIRRMAERDPVYLDYVGEGESYATVADFGVNFSGWGRITAYGAPGQKIRIRYGETLRADGRVDQRNLRRAKAEDTFVFGETRRMTFEPHFVYHGFRYAQIMTDPGVVIGEIKGCEVRTDVRQIGQFACSDETVNRIQRAVLQTEKCNLHSVPTDCPQRDERLGWMNDMTVRFEEALYNFDMVLFYEKWLQDIADAQRADGAIPDTCPYFFGSLPATHISGVYVLLPWYLYLFYGDRQILARHYAGMLRYVRFMLKERGEDGLLPDRYIGEWSPPMTECYIGEGLNAIPKNLTHRFLTTCYLYYECRILEKAAVLLGFPEDAGECAAEAMRIRETVNRLFLREEGGYDTGAQGCNVFPLFLGIVPEERKKPVLDALLADLVEKRHTRITTGNQMTKYLYEVLNQENRNEIAYRIASSVTYPSLGFMLEKGATTVWERWEYLTDRQMNSHNHPMLGAFTAWFYKGLVGILPEAAENGEGGRFMLRPAIFAPLTCAEGSHEFPQGLCSLRWERFGGETVCRFCVPWNTEARLDLSHCSIPFREILCDGEPVSRGELESRVFPGGEYHVVLRE